MIVYQSRFLTRGEVWFENHPSREPVDWIVFHQRAQPCPKGNWRPFYTRVLDLKQNPDALLRQMDGFTASDIKKAENKDQTTCQRLEANDASVLEEFYEFYDRFAAWKQLPPADRYWLARTAKASKLEIWVANDPDHVPLVYHALYRDGNRARSVHLASVRFPSR